MFRFDPVLRPEIQTGESPIRTAPLTAAVLACSFFFLLGCAFIPHLGIQNDEALFASGLYEPVGLAYHRQAFGHKIPVMLMTYLGALKCWIYAGVFHFWQPSPSSVRVPMLLAGSLTVWLFFLLLRRAASARAAVIGCILLAADTSFLLTATFDWGPVALQHLLLAGAVLLLAIFARNRRWEALAGACFLLGLGAWDKALFLWLAAGLGAACVTVYPREILRLLTPSRALVAVLAFALGSLPLLLYNLNPRHRMETFRSNAAYSADDLHGKAALFRYSLEGSALLGWLVAEDYEPPAPRQARTPIERASAWLSAVSGRPRRNLFWYGFLLSLGLALWLWLSHRWKGEGRIVAAALVFLAVAWLQMAFTRNAGGALHHTILLWPAPHLVMAVSLAAASRQFRGGAPAVAALTTVLAASGILVTNQHYAQMIRNGGGLNWTEAVYPLADFVKQLPARQIYVTDWGMFDTLRLLGQGRLPLSVGSDPVSKPVLDEADLRVVHSWVSDPTHIFAGHTEGNEFFSGSRKNLLRAAESFGLRREMLRVVEDRHGRRVFEVFRFVR